MKKKRIAMLLAAALTFSQSMGAAIPRISHTADDLLINIFHSAKQIHQSMFRGSI